MKKLYDLFGWLGVVLIITAYTLSTFGLIDPRQPLGLVLNGLGAIGIIIDSGHQHDWQPVVLNLFWLVIAIIGLVRYGLT